MHTPFVLIYEHTYEKVDKKCVLPLKERHWPQNGWWWIVVTAMGFFSFHWAVHCIIACTDAVCSMRIASPAANISAARTIYSELCDRTTYFHFISLHTKCISLQTKYIYLSTKNISLQTKCISLQTQCIFCQPSVFLCKPNIFLRQVYFCQPKTKVCGFLSSLQTPPAEPKTLVKTNVKSRENVRGMCCKSELGTKDDPLSDSGILQLELHCIVGDAPFRSNRMWGDVGDCMVRCVVVGVSLCVQETSRNSIAF